MARDWTGKLSQARRLLAWVEAMKRGRYPNATTLAADLSARAGSHSGVCPRTLHRDLAVLRHRLHAPIEYDPLHKGFLLTDPEWCFPLEQLRGELFYASLLGEALSVSLLPDPLRFSLQEAMRIRLAAAEPADFDADLLRAVVFATGATAELDPAVFDVIHQAWRERRRARLCYQGTGDGGAVQRDVDVHALFLSQGAWYARVHCHLRDAPRSLAIHRIREPSLLRQRFRRDEALLAAVRQGSVFDYEIVRNVVIDCAPEKARVVSEREWFPGQKTKPLPGGGVRATFAQVPRPEVVHWVMSYCGHLTVRRPEDLVEEIRRAGQRIAVKHTRPRRSS